MVVLIASLPLKFLKALIVCTATDEDWSQNVEVWRYKQRVKAVCRKRYIEAKHGTGSRFFFYLCRPINRQTCMHAGFDVKWRCSLVAMSLCCTACKILALWC